jgi:hypothetical protein
MQGIRRQRLRIYRAGEIPTIARPIAVVGLCCVVLSQLSSQWQQELAVRPQYARPRRRVNADPAATPATAPDTPVIKRTSSTTVAVDVFVIVIVRSSSRARIL